MKFGSYIQLTDKLNEEYRKSFDFIEHYGNVHMVSFEKMAEKMMDLIDLMLEAQEKGQSPEEITGKNLEDFCKNFLLMFCIGFIVSIITGEKMFETPLDVLVYIMINAVIWFLYIRFFKKIEKVSLLEQQSILKACQEQGMELDEYYNMLMKRE